MPSQPGQISLVFAWPGRTKESTGLRLGVLERSLHVVAHFKR